MTLMIVVELEVVDVEERYRERAKGPKGSGVHPLQLILHSPPVAESSQSIGEGQLSQALVCPYGAESPACLQDEASRRVANLSG